MEDKDYMFLLIDGYLAGDPKYTAERYHRKCVEAESKHITPFEFYERLRKQLQTLNHEVKSQTNKRKVDLSRERALIKQTGTSLKGVEQVADVPVQPIQGTYIAQLTNHMYWTSLTAFHLSIIDKEIERAIEKTSVKHTGVLPKALKPPKQKRKLRQTLREFMTDTDYDFVIAKLLDAGWINDKCHWIDKAYTIEFIAGLIRYLRDQSYFTNRAVTGRDSWRILNHSFNVPCYYTSANNGFQSVDNWSAYRKVLPLLKDR